MTYATDVSTYLERIDRLLKDGSESSLLYATLELRCGVEARLKEYLEPQEHVPKYQKKEWAVAKLGRTIERAFRSGDKIMIFTVRSDRLNKECSFMYTPVSRRLQEIASRLGDYLHVPKRESVHDGAWWATLRELVREGYGELMLANSGELIGMPMLHKPSGRLNLRVVLADGDPRQQFILGLAETREMHVVKVEYIEPVPGKKSFYES